ncbi:hypothetical protein [Leisingera sp. JC1]|nr:hypothetical protein [Leisingera sp. JC1]
MSIKASQDLIVRGKPDCGELRQQFFRLVGLALRKAGERPQR